MTKHQGFTLIELMITLAIFGVLAIFAAPSFSEYRANNRLDNAARLTGQHLKLARAAAIQNNTIVEIRQVDGATSGDWLTGWDIVRLSNPELVLYRADNLTRNDLSVNSSPSGDDGVISFLPNGRLNENNSGLGIAVCDGRGIAHGVYITVNRVGRIREEATPSCDPLVNP